MYIKNMKTDKIATADELNLSEEYVPPQELRALRKYWGYEEYISMFAHVVYNTETSELIYYAAATEDFRNSLPKKSFIDGWLEIKNGNEWVKRMYKTTYALAPSKASRKMRLPENIERILAPTDGYLIYQDQMTAILHHVRQANPALIPMYIRNWNLKKPTTRFMVSTVWVQGINLDDLIEDRVYDSENQFLFS